MSSPDNVYRISTTIMSQPLSIINNDEFGIATTENLGRRAVELTVELARTSS
jgi:hypothetical protein